MSAERPQGPVVPALAGDPPIDPELRVGHVHLRTADIDRVRAFYVGVMGFDVVFEARDVPGWGTTGDILFLSAGGYHHHPGFKTPKSAGGAPPPPRGAGAPPPTPSASTPGSRRAARRSLTAWPVCITSRSTSPRASGWPRWCAASST